MKTGQACSFADRALPQPVNTSPTTRRPSACLAAGRTVLDTRLGARSAAAAAPLGQSAVPVSSPTRRRLTRRSAPLVTRPSPRARVIDRSLAPLELHPGALGEGFAPLACERFERREFRRNQLREAHHLDLG